MYGTPFGIKTHRNKGFSTTQNNVIFRKHFNEGQTWIQLCNGKIDERANHLCTGVNINKTLLTFLVKKLAEKGCSTIHASDDADVLIVKTTVERRVWRYQRGNQNPYIEEQTTQWPNEKVQKDKQRYTKHTYKTKDRVTRTPLKTGGELRCSVRVSSSCSTSDTRCVNLVTNPVISHE
jgi:hypothetical protein